MIPASPLRGICGRQVQSLCPVNTARWLFDDDQAAAVAKFFKDTSKTAARRAKFPEVRN